MRQRLRRVAAALGAALVLCPLATVTQAAHAGVAQAATVAAAGGEAAEHALVLVPEQVAWARVLTLGVMWLFLAALLVGLIVTWIGPAEAPRPAATHSRNDGGHH